MDQQAVTVNSVYCRDPIDTGHRSSCKRCSREHLFPMFIHVRLFSMRCRIRRGDFMHLFHPLSLSLGVVSNCSSVFMDRTPFASICIVCCLLNCSHFPASGYYHNHYHNHYFIMAARRMSAGLDVLPLCFIVPSFFLTPRL